MSTTEIKKTGPQCETCGKYFRTVWNLKIHRRVHTGEEPFPCGYCNRSFKYITSYGVHVISVHGKQLKKPQAPHTNADGRQPLKHRKPTSSPSPANRVRSEPCFCYICQRPFSTYQALKSHMQLHETTTSKISQAAQTPSSSNNARVADHGSNSPATKRAQSPKPGKFTDGKFKIPKLVKRDNTPARASAGATNIASPKAKENTAMICNQGLATGNRDTYAQVDNAEPMSRSKVEGQLKKIIHEPPNTEVAHNRNLNNHQSVEETTTSDEHVIQKKSRIDCLRYHSIHTKKCLTCGAAFLSKDDLYKHRTENKRCLAKGSKLPCPKCDKSFFLHMNLRRHIKLAHTERQVYECSICKEKLNSLKAFLTHKRTHKMFYQCKLCYKCFDTKDGQMRHSRTSHIREQVYKCPFCDRSFAMKTYRAKHVKLVHKKKLLKRASDSGPIDNDNSGSRAKTRIRCKQCNASFSKEYLLRKHVMKIHWKEDNKMAEKKNTARTRDDKSTGESTQAPSTICSKGKQYACDTCGTIFTRRANLKAHIDQKHFHGTLGEESLRAVVSNLTENAPSGDSELVISEAELRRQGGKMKDIEQTEYYVPFDVIKATEVDPATGDKLYICEVCMTTYSMKVNLVRHIKKRAYDHGFYLRRRIKKYQVSKIQPLCDRKFESALTQSSFKVKCDVCENTYTRRYNMFYHRQKHTDEEFQRAGVRKDAYITADGRYIPVPKSHTHFNTTDHEVTSSTSKDLADTSDTDSAEVTVYVDNADDDIDDMETEPVFFARPYFAEKDKNTDLTQNQDKQDNPVIRRLLQRSDKSRYSEDRGRVTGNVEVSTAGQLELTEQMAATGQFVHTQGQTNTCQRMNSDVTGEFNTGSPEYMNRPAQVSQDKLLSEPVHGSSSVGTISSTQSVHVVGVGSACSACKLQFLDGQNRIRCSLCNQIFCRYCSGVPNDVYNILFKNECAGSIWWTCGVCKHLVPKFTVLLKQLGDFEEVINNRLSDLEQRLSKMKPNGT